MAPLVSIVIPAFNPGAYLHETVWSVLAQTLTDWEAVVVDDGSTEDLSWVDDVDPRVRRVRQANAGLSAARNRGIAETASELVAFLDADDVWLPTKLARQLPAHDDSDVALTSTGFSIIDERGVEVAPGYTGHASTYEELLTGNGICASTVMMRRSMISTVGGFDSRLAQCEDWDLWLRTSSDHRVLKVESVLARYRVHSGNMTKDYMAWRRSAREVLDRQTILAQRRGDTHRAMLAASGVKRVDELAAHQAIDAAREAFRRRSWTTVGHLARAAQVSPVALASHARAWLRRSGGRLTARA